ncbi:DUF742 domain-containing protein, partial [Streptomyces rochei]|uniref:DUF742 domain-containing protein n=1 Tax=Streptomyces rochei TaxID=1928 RepID=UPI002FDBCAF7
GDLGHRTHAAAQFDDGPHLRHHAGGEAAVRQFLALLGGLQRGGAGGGAALEAAEERKELTNGSLTSRVMPEMRAIVELCRRMRTVAEIAALLKMPLGVVRVLISDLADQGKIRVYGTGTGHGTGRPDRALLERVLSGLRRL